MVADEEADAGLSQLLQVGFLEGLGGFQFEVHHVEPHSRALGEDFEFGGQGASELAAIR